MENKFNFEPTNSYWYADAYDMVMYSHLFYDHDYVKRDSIGRTYEAFVAYGDRRFLNAIKSCWRGGEGVRHPSGHPVGMSRDHVMNTVYALVEAGEDFSDFVGSLKWKISDFASFTISMWLYLHLLQGKKWAKIYYPLMYLEMSFWKKWNKVLYKLTGVGALGWEEDPHKFEPILKDWPRVLVFLSDILFPNYTLRHRAIQWSLLPKSKWVNRLQRLSWDFVPKYNYVLKILLSHPDRVTRDQVRSYVSMSGDRWSDVLNPWINYGRHIYVLPKHKVGENQLDKDYLIKIYERHYGERF